MSGQIVERVLRSPRYRDVDRALVARLVREEAPKARNEDEHVKRVKRRLHQAVGAYRGASDADRILQPIREQWAGDLRDETFRAACRAALAGHASTSERVPHLEGFFAPIWKLAGGSPRRLVDMGCGLGPLSLPWMGLPPGAAYHAVDVDRRSLAVVEGFLALVGQPGGVHERDLVADWRVPAPAEVALLLKLVPLLDRQDPSAAARLIADLDVRHAVVSFPARSLGARRSGFEATYRRRLEELSGDAGARVVGEASVPNELVFVLALRG